MSPDWKDFLNTQAGKFDVKDLLCLPKSDIQETRDIITDLSHLALIEVTGENAVDFLNGQFTTNIKQLEKNHLQISAWCNPRGQVKIIFLIYRHEAGLNILLPNELKDSFLQQLKMYIMRSSVKFADKSDELVRVGLQINKENLPDDLIKPNLHCLRMINSESNLQRYIFIGTVERLTSLWKELSRYNIPVSTSVWKLLDIQAGCPWLSPQTTEKFLPQMLNMDLIDGLDYQKGCYPGQEIIARLHFRGQLKRSLYLATCSLDAEIKIADQIYTNDHENSGGVVINAQAHKDKYYLLAVIEKELVENNTTLRESNGAILELQALPYQGL